MRRLVPLVGFVLALAGCGPSEEQRRAADEAQAVEELAGYRELVAKKEGERALAAADDIERRHPGSKVAAELHASRAELEAKIKGAADEQRLAQLWTYETGVQSGGQQSAASIFSRNTGDGVEAVRLILRRHEKWGEDVYLFASGKGFECPNPCTIFVRYDGGEPQRTAAFLPATGEPAIFVKDDADFLARLPDVGRVEILAMLAGRGPVTFEFEVGGYEPERFAPLPGAG